MNKYSLPKDYLEIMDDFKYVEEVIKKNSKTFYQSFSMLPDKKRFAIYSVYAFCREADDLVDESKNAEDLKKLEEELYLFSKGKELDKPIWSTLRVVFNNFDMSIDPFYDMIKGQYMDIDFIQPPTQDHLEDYSYHVASSVGLMILPILSENSDQIKDEAIKLGIAMQITNIMRDLYEDYNNDRIYIPSKLLEQFNYDFEYDMNNKSLSDEFHTLWNFQKNRAINLYNESEKMLDRIDQDSRKAVLLALEYYKAILFQIENNGFDVFGDKTKVNKLKKLEILNDVNKKLKMYN